METKSLLIGIISFMAGGLLVSVAAVTFEKDNDQTANNTTSSVMQNSANSLQNKTGDDFDQSFMTEMTAHHQGAIKMAKLAQTNAKHPEIKQLSSDIISAQEKEISQMKQWKIDWGYKDTVTPHDTSNMNH